MKRDPNVDLLYQLPLREFTEKRNALAKELSGEARTRVRFLTKPPVPVWAVNQLHWKDRATYGALINASEQLRDAHRATLAGRKADIRKAEQLHRMALEQAFIKTMALAEKSGEQLSDASRQTIRTILAALPTEEEAGHLTQVPEPAGFTLLTGIKPQKKKTRST